MNRTARRFLLLAPAKQHEIACGKIPPAASRNFYPPLGIFVTTRAEVATRTKPSAVLAMAGAWKQPKVLSLSIHIGPDHDDILYPDLVPFLAVHAGCVAAIWSGVTWQAMAICAVLYWLRMFAITGGYHRYFIATSRIGPIRQAGYFNSS
jgi:hypothetical protein